MLVFFVFAIPLFMLLLAVGQHSGKDGLMALGWGASGLCLFLILMMFKGYS
jgi:hypothetical protein